MINILELESSSGFGGQEHRTQRVINNLDKNNFRVFYGLNKGSKSFEKDIDCRFVEFNLNKIYNIFAISQICSFIKNNKIDIISTHSGKDANIGSIVAKLCNVKLVRTRHLQIPIPSPVSYNLSDRVVAVSKAVKNSLINCGVKQNLIDVIYTGIDTDLYNPNKNRDLKKELCLNDSDILIAIVAVLRDAKNHKLLIEALNELNIDNLKLAIIGDGPGENYLKDLTKNNKNIFMLGNRNDVSEFIASVDIFVLPSKMEALGTAILEASSAGVPCIGSNVGGIAEAIIDEKTGLLFESENKNELKAAICKMVFDKDLRNNFKENARNHIVNNFSISKMIEDTQKLYFDLVSKS